MNILLINMSNLSSQKVPGGAEKVLLEIIHCSGKKEFCFTMILSSGDPTGKRFCRLGANVYVKNFRSFFSFFHVFYLVLLIKKKKIDLIHTNECRGNFFGSLAGILTGVPVVSCRHELYFSPFITGKISWKRKLYRLVDMFFFHLVSRKLIAVSQAVKNEIIMSQKINPDKIEVISFGIDPDKVKELSLDIRDLKDEFKIKEENPVIVTVANLSREKGYDVLLDAAYYVKKNISTVRFICFGEGKYRLTLEKKIKQLGLEGTVILAGFKENILDYLRIADLFVLPSLAEGMSKSLMEAMLMKKPAIASNIGSLPEIIKDGINGLLVPPGDAHALKSAIIELLGDKDKAQRIADEGYKSVIKYYRLEKAIKQLELIYYSFK